MTLFNKAIPVLKSDTINIPQPGEYFSGQASGISAGANVIVPGAEFEGEYNASGTGRALGSNSTSRGDAPV